MINVILQMMDTLGVGVALLDRRGLILQVQGIFNAAAELLTRDHLNPLISREITLHFQNDQAGPLSIICRQGPGRPVALICFRAGSWFGEAEYVMLAADLNLLPRPKVSALRRLFGLTPKEARLASALGRGRTVEEVANEDQVSVSTVRTQIKAVFEKTQTNRQAELAALLARTCFMPGTRSQIPITEVHLDASLAEK